MPLSHSVIDKYVQEVVSGDVTTGTLERLACERYLHDVAEGFWLFDEKRAQSAIDFFPTFLRHGKGKWGATSRRKAQPFELTPWQQFVVWNLVGWRYPEPNDDGLHTRRFRKSYISLARKNGKTAMMAGLVLYFFMLKDDPSPEVYVMGAKQEQSRILFDLASKMVVASPSINRRCHVQVGNIKNTENDGVLVPLACGPEHGRSPSIVVYDEVHEYQELHRTSYDALNTGSGSRESPLHSIITTSGDPAGGSPIWEEEDNAGRKVLETACGDNPIGENNFVFVCRYDKGDDFFDPANFRKANPNLDITISTSYLELELAEAKARPERRYTWQRYHCNYPVGSRLKAIEASDWAANAAKAPDGLEGSICYGGLDAGRVHDFASFALMWPLDDDTYWLQTWTWTCEVSDAGTNREPFTTWAELGYITIHPGDAVDLGQVRQDIIEILGKYRCVTLTFDKHEANVVAHDVQNATGVPLEEMPQSYAFYNEPTKKFVNHAVPDGMILHDGDPVLAWAADNLTIKRDARDMWMPEKSHKQRKIDPIVATLMAYRTALFNENQVRDYYESNEVEVG